jgi:hypothetical protein
VPLYWSLYHIFTDWEALHIAFSASPILSHITRNLVSSGGKTVFAKSKMVALKIKEKYIQHPNTKTISFDWIDTTFDPPWFSLDNTFQETILSHFKKYLARARSEGVREVTCLVCLQ